MAQRTNCTKFVSRIGWKNPCGDLNFVTGEGHQLWDLNGTFIYDAMIHVDYQNQPITFREEMICQLNFE